ncbi:hypothetical protein [Salmonella phage NINP13076]|nr:hypothetical protein [Salmonella phage NINP13076]
MRIQNKIVAVGLSVDVDFMYTGAIVRIIFKKDGCEHYEYLTTSNRRTLSLKKFKRGEWETIIPADYTLNPLEITTEEALMVSILPGLSPFERSLYTMAGVITRMWHNDADEEYAKKYVIEFLKDYLEW